MIAYSDLFTTYPELTIDANGITFGVDTVAQPDAREFLSDVLKSAKEGYLFTAPHQNFQVNSETVFNTRFGTATETYTVKFIRQLQVSSIAPNAVPSI